MTRPANRVALPGRLMLAPLLLTTLALPAPEALGDSISDFGFNGFLQYNQTANNTPGTNPTAFYDSYLLYTASGDVTAASGTSGAVATGQASFTYAPSGTAATYSSGSITPAQLSDYMMQGTDFTANVSSGSLAGQSASVAYGPTLFQPDAAYLTGNTYSALQNMDPTQDLTLTFNSVTAGAGATQASGTLAIYNPSTDSVLYAESFSPGTTSLLLAANTLAAGTTYELLLDYDNTVSTANAGFGGATFSAEYDDYDYVSFTTATPSVVPEPASLALAAIGVASAVLVARRRRARPSA